jgi:ComF family protein
MKQFFYRTLRKSARGAAVIREYLFALGCALCGSPLLETEEAWYGLCSPCRERFAVPDEPRCSSCGRPLISEQGRCLSCREGEGYHFDGAFGIFPYAGKYRKLLGAYKFGKYRAVGNFLAEKLREGLALFSAAGEMAAPVWIPVPPRPGKIKRTGWDQLAHLARLLKAPGGGERPPIPVYPCLKRLPSQSQKELNRQDRRENLRGRIRCTGKPPREVLLFDDVMTTGSTLDACAAALKDGGAEKVYALSLFYD